MNENTTVAGVLPGKNRKQHPSYELEIIAETGFLAQGVGATAPAAIAEKPRRRTNSVDQSFFVRHFTIDVPNKLRAGTYSISASAIAVYV